MLCILNVETSSTTCSVSISNDSFLVWNRESSADRKHAIILGVFIQEAISFAKEMGYTLSAIAVSCGPGSYTGLRIGTSLCKGLCYGLDIPLIAVSTPKILIEGVKEFHDNENFLFCPMIDARRMEVYTGLWDFEGNEVRKISAEIIDSKFLNKELDQHSIFFFGDGAEKCKDIIQHKDAHFIDGIKPLSKNMIVLAEELFKKNKFVDTAYFEPFYLKDFMLTESKKKYF